MGGCISSSNNTQQQEQRCGDDSDSHKDNTLQDKQEKEESFCLQQSKILLSNNNDVDDEGVVVDPAAVASADDSAPHQVQPDDQQRRSHENEKISSSASSSSSSTNKYKNDVDVIIDPIEYQTWLSRVQKNGWDLQYAPDYIRSSKPVVIAAIQQSDGWAIQFATPQLQNDPDIIAMLTTTTTSTGNGVDDAATKGVVAVDSSSSCNKYNDNNSTVATTSTTNASTKWKVGQRIKVINRRGGKVQNGTGIIMQVHDRTKAVTIRWDHKPHLSVSRVYMTSIAIYREGTTIRKNNNLAKEKNRYDNTNEKEYWISKVQKNAGDLQYAPDHLRTDKDVVLEAMSTVRKNEKEYWISRVKENACDLQYAPYHLRADKDVVDAATKREENAVVSPTWYWGSHPCSCWKTFEPMSVNDNIEYAYQLYLKGGWGWGSFELKTGNYGSRTIDFITMKLFNNKTGLQFDLKRQQEGQ